MKKVLAFILLVSLGFLSGCDEVVITPNPPTPTVDADYDRLFDDDNEKSFTIEVSAIEFNKLDQYMVDYYNRLDRKSVV